MTHPSDGGGRKPLAIDVVVVGAGVAGLSMVRSLAGSGLAVALVEPQEVAGLADPAFDGREIALTQHSVHLLRRLGVWQLLPADGVHALRDALVLDGDELPGLRLEHGDGGCAQLGMLRSMRN